ncbi:ankyrin repeat-containing domain protein [Scenedesmus sp. NREL 46B-D3]|nr:ankyrin repeat-containing domain protein [Scenedesmus sp. NREL 46B-D3]
MGADVNAQMQHGLTPLHLACLGRVGGAAVMAKLAEAAKLSFTEYAGPACSSIVQMLLQHGAVADTDITPLHLLACWSPELGGAVKAEDQHSSNEDEGVGNGTNKKTNSSMTAAAHPGNRGASSSSSSSSSTQAQDAALLAARRAGVQEQLTAARLLIAGHRMPDGSISGRIDVDAATAVHGETPLTTAAITGAFEIAELLLQHGADLNLPRTLDAARPIDIAVCMGQLEIARLLLEHGAEVKQGPLLVENTSAGAGGAKLPEQHPEMILLTTLRNEHPVKARVVQLLLQRGAPLEEVWEPTGETALSMAVAAGDVEVVRLLVAAGADLDACRAKEPLWPPLAVAAFEGKLEILQILLDAGADYTSYINEQSGYDMVQAAASCGQFEAVVKLVEAGASWRLSPGQARAIGDTPYYVPDILRLKCKAGLTLKVWGLGAAA